MSGAYASIRKLPHPGFVALAAAANSSLTGVSFFGAFLHSLPACLFPFPDSQTELFLLPGCREFLVSPTLNRLAPWPQYARRRQEMRIESLSQDPNASNTPVSLPDLRTNQLLDSAISGASVVGVFHAMCMSSPQIQLNYADRIST